MINIEKLSKLAGMIFHQGETAPFWIGSTGINPEKFVPYIRITDGRCYWTDKAEQIYQAECQRVKNNFTAIGV